MDKETILIADDDTSIRRVLEEAISRAGYTVRCCSNSATLWEWVSAGEGDLIITDVVMPDENGLELIPKIRSSRPNIPIIVISARTTLMTALKATERGAFEYLPKPFDINKLVEVVKRALQTVKDEAIHQIPDLVEEEAAPIVGSAPSMQEVFRNLARLIPTDLTTLVSGESGTGKELVARALHDFGKRKHGPFVAVNMAAVPRELIESELFGHERGAFTGAVTRHIGRFAQAEHGTLFLDEIGDMPRDAQTRLLRVLQDGEYLPVGGTQPVRTHVRIVAASHQPLRQLVDQGQFREDLFYRLNVAQIRLPPLRERVSDIPVLVGHFLLKAVEEGLPNKMIDSEGLGLLKSYHWPGNVRELENLVRRLAALSTDDMIGGSIIEGELKAMANEVTLPVGPSNISGAVVEHLKKYFQAHHNGMPPSGLYDRVIQEVEKPLIQMSLAATHGNQLKAAVLLGLNRNTLRKKIQNLKISVVRGHK